MSTKVYTFEKGKLKGLTITPNVISNEAYSAMIEQRQQDERRDRIETYRNACFTDKTLRRCTFENDDRANSEISDRARKYVKQFDLKSKGLLLFGTVGTGKTFIAACIANALVNQCYSCYMTTFARISNDMQATWEKQDYIKRLMRHDLIIIDDLAAERNTEYMNEVIFSVIDERYRSGKPIIVTTNLTWAELKNPDSITKSRVYSRLFEMCWPIHIKGTDRRIDKFKAAYMAEHHA